MSDARLEMLEAENAMLRERIALIERELLGADLALPIEWRLTGQEQAVVAAILRREVARKEQIMTALYGHRDDEPHQKIVDVFVCKVRKKLAPFGVKIETVWGQGFRVAEPLRSELLRRATPTAWARRLKVKPAIGKAPRVASVGSTPVPPKAASTKPSPPSIVPGSLEAVRSIVAARRGALAADALIRRLEADPHKATIARLWAEGRSSHEIAAALDDGTTRNAIIGQLHRLGLKDDMRSVRRRRWDAGGVEKPAKPRPTAAARPEPRIVAALPPASVAPDIDDEPLPVGPAMGIAIDELEQHHCRWIIAGEREFARYCGDPRVERGDGKLRPYCAAHVRMAYVPQERKARTALQVAGDLQRARTLRGRVAA